LVEDPKLFDVEFELARGDSLVLYTDGVTEARTRDGTRFGVERLVRLAAQCEAARLPAPETLRRLALAVADHQAGPPTDDATLMLAHWSPEAARRVLPQPALEVAESEGEQP